MNPQIKSLMEQAMVKTADMSRPGRKELDPEKFAELILTQCIANIECSTFGGHQGEYYRDNVVVNLKQHFGVKE